MQHNFLSKILGASVLALGLTIATHLPASATTAPPTDTAPSVDTTAPAPIDANTDVDTDTDAEDDGFDWGWLGLLGLIGLAGLNRKNDDRVARYREPDEVGSSTSSGPRY
ncbi:MAG: WGxxGxxG family protein [Oculatellaceae cyanobacterium bins.114]|nr:WGxxGxxG family protein [Oculatellaceae cyanobacterium bins.114]